MRATRSYLKAESWSWNRTKVHGQQVDEWFRREGWFVHGGSRGERHAFVDELTTPSITVRRVWHTPIRIEDAAPSALGMSPQPLSVWMHVGGDLSVSIDSCAVVPIRPRSAFFHTRRPQAVENTRATARFEISLARRSDDKVASQMIVDRNHSLTWSALAGVINAVMNAHEAPDTRLLALYAQSIETLVQALRFESDFANISIAGDTFSRASRLISEHASEPTFTVEQLAHKLGVTRAHVTRVFRQRGTTPSHALKRERLHRARTMLAIDPTASYETVARMCGFSSTRLLRESLRSSVPAGAAAD